MHGLKLHCVRESPSDLLSIPPLKIVGGHLADMLYGIRTKLSLYHLQIIGVIEIALKGTISEAKHLARRQMFCRQGERIHGVLGITGPVPRKRPLFFEGQVV